MKTTPLSNSHSKSLLSKINFKKLLFWYLIIVLVTILLLLPDLVFLVKNKVYNYAITGIFIVQLLLFVPVFLFSRILKVYYWLIAFVVAFAPIMLLSVFYMNIQVNAEMVGLVLDTNKDEVTELLGWKILFIILAMVFLAWLVIKLTSYLPQKISWKKGLLVSLVGIVGFLIIPLIRTTDTQYYSAILRNTYKTYYPFRLQMLFSMLHEQLGNMERYQETTKNFKFHAVNTDTAANDRKIVVMIVGEASRPDHWHINGYSRETSPEIEKLPDLITFKNAVAGGSMTIISVPQLITRATPEDYLRHTKEKSILGAFKEAGFYTAWISNQSHYGLSGEIGMHFTDGDTAIYTGHGENETNFTGKYDETILPILSKVINQHPKKNIFLIVHMIGSHWRYVLRYPPSFQKFEPTSDRNKMNMINPTKEEVINEYDNSILYTDHILKCIADTLAKQNAESAFLFVSDHGENLNDNNDNTYFHSFKPTKYSSIVAMFAWANEKYVKKNPQIWDNLERNKDLKISTALNVFYTVIDMGRLSISGFDSTASLARPTFVSPPQLLYGDEGKIYNFKDLK